MSTPSSTPDPTPMIWTRTLPTAGKVFRWREDRHGRVHNVRVSRKGGGVQLACKTMDIRWLLAGGEWSAKPAASDATDDTAGDGLEQL